MQEPTITAIATPPGQGGVGIIRLSGPEALVIARKISQCDEIIPNKFKYRSFFDADGELVDQGLLLYFKAPHSFTGDDVIEFHTHGSPVVLDALLHTCVRLGAALAKPGEFSKRAFLNNKIDLTQAEAVADLIQASSMAAARMALRSLQGEFSKKIDAISEQLIYLRLYVEAAIDFPDEEVDFLKQGKIEQLVQELIEDLSDLEKNAHVGTMMREGIAVVIAGKPNAGKSTLINALAKRDVAIVTDVPGTTRDVMREQVLLDELPLHLIDTAGLRESSCLVEKEGIRRAWDEIARADCVLLVKDMHDLSEPISLDEDIRKALPDGVPIITVYNKIDTSGKKPTQNQKGIYLSAKQGLGLDLLKSEIKACVGYLPTEGLFLARRRHLDALHAATACLTQGQLQLKTHQASELLAEDLRLAHQQLGEITGEFRSDDLLGRIFSSFCIGK